MDIVALLSIVLILSPLLFMVLIASDLTLAAKIVIGTVGLFLFSCLPYVALLVGGSAATQ